MYEIIPMYVKTKLFVKQDKFLLIYCAHVPMKYLKEEKRQIREKENASNRLKLKQSPKVLSVNEKRYNKRTMH